MSVIRIVYFFTSLKHADNNRIIFFTLKKYSDPAHYVLRITICIDLFLLQHRQSC